ncbi:cell division protein FtsQ/DivIB [Heliophilum fasciatum]|uniref:Cell division protein FtsQ n=1 Tax=Heliophilum fasciatum TaxID=35700 RepID=A0A4R2RHM0_9FIRM|nr:FtsQ-type POTRA domain-containing protein [Heliophilum fasciatum]MCW2278860.1 cell division protein FtsQ [Heliophilum fasciatum]TCP62128.1 cell division protein FtsQ [Heliophilum fasciatum]
MLRQRASKLLFSFIAMALVATYFFLRSPFFGITHVSVQGTSLLPEAEMVQLSGIQLGENIWRLDEKRVVQQLLFHPQVEAIALERQWPSTVILQIKERKPVAVVHGPRGFILVDHQGTFLQTVNALTGIPLPLLTGIPVSSQVGPGQAFTGDEMAAALRFCREFAPTLMTRIAEVHVREGGRLTLYTVEGVEVRFGTPDQVAAKGDALADIFAELTREQRLGKIRYIDVTSHTSPVIKL